jgi:pimeloyl-ACP methyl ester carboxylesterase
MASKASGAAGPSPLVDLGGEGKPLFFLHANGYPPDCYSHLLGLLRRRFHTYAVLLRPLWPNSKPGELRDWRLLGRDLLELFEENDVPAAIVVGHSMGAIAALRAALTAPSRFAVLVLLEPVLLPPHAIIAWRSARALGLGALAHPLIRRALRRRRTFDSLERLFQSYRSRPIFRYLPDASLRILIEGMTSPLAGQGYSLSYSPEWEARVYETGIWNDLDLWHGIARLEVPTLIVRGAETDTFSESAARSVQRKNGGIRIVTMQKSTHLVPFEKPQSVFESIQRFVQERLEDEQNGRL